MKGYVKVIIAGAIIIGIGLAVLLVALGLNGWTFAPNFTTQEFTSTELNTSLSVNLDVGKLKIEYRDDDGEEILITYPVARGYETTISEDAGKLSIESNKHRWYTFTWGISIPETVIKIPKNTVENVEIDVDAGAVDMCGGAFNKVSVTVDAGTLNVGEITECNFFDVKVNAGTMKAISGVESANFTCEVNAGTASIKRIHCLKADIEVNAGSADLSFTGDREDYGANVNVAAGSCTGISSGPGSLTGKHIYVKVNAGSLDVKFTG